MKIRKLLFGAVLLSIFSVVSAFGEIPRKAIFTIVGKIGSGGTHEVTLSVDGIGRKFSFSGSSGTWQKSSTQLIVDAQVGDTLLATVSGEVGLSDYRIFASQDRQIDNLASFNLEFDETRLGGIRKSDIAGNVFEARVRLTGYSGSPIGTLDYEKAFLIPYKDEDTQVPLRHMHLSLGYNASGDSNGFLEIDAKNMNQTGTSKIKLVPGRGIVDTYGSPNGSRQILTPSHLITIEEGSVSKELFVKFYANDSYSALPQYPTQVLATYHFTNIGSNAFKIRRQVGTLTYDLDYYYSSTSQVTDEEEDELYHYQFTDFTHLVSIKPWYKMGASPVLEIESSSESRRYREFEPGVGNGWVTLEDYTPGEHIERTYYDNGTVIYKEWIDSSGPNIGTITKGTSLQNGVNSYTSRLHYNYGSSVSNFGNGTSTSEPLDDSNLGSEPLSALGKLKESKKTFKDIGNQLVTTYSYTESSDGLEAWPTLVETKYGSTAIGSRSLEVLNYEPQEGSFSPVSGISYPAVTLTSFASTDGGTSSSSKLKTITKSYRKSVPDPFYAGRPISIIKPDGTKTSYGYETGNWDVYNESWVPGSGGTDFRVVSITGMNGATISSFEGMNLDPVSIGSAVGSSYQLSWGQPLVEQIFGKHGKVVKEAQWVYVNNMPQLVSQVIHTYDDFGNLIQSRTPASSENAELVLYEASYINGQKVSEKDVSGLETTYIYDDYGRVSMVSKEGVSSAVEEIVTTYERDGLGRITKEKVGLVGSQKVSEISYDNAGRVSSTKAPGGFETVYSYDYNIAGTSTTTILYPDGSTAAESVHADGRLKSVSGTATTNIDYSYSFNSSGFLETKETYSESDEFGTSDQWNVSISDWIGRVVESKSPSPDGGEIKAKRHYNSKGQLTMEEYLHGTTRVSPSSLFKYDDYGKLWMTGNDSDNSNGLNSHIDANTVMHQKIYLKLLNSPYDPRMDYGAWYYREAQLIFGREGEGEWTVGGMQYTQLGGFDEDVIAHTVQQGVRASNSVHTTVTVDRDFRTSTTRVDIPGTDRMELTVAVGGLPISFTNTQGHSSAMVYDALGRPTSATDSRNLLTTYDYYSNAAGETDLVWKVTENDGQVTEYGYDTAGRQLFTKDADGGYSYTEHDPDTRTVYTYGSAARPTKTIFDDLGRQVELHTYRSEKSGPTAMSAAGDKTTWTYDSMTGLMTKKTYADGNFTEYTDFDAAGRLLEVVDARDVTTKYTYYTSADASNNEFSGLVKQIDYTLPQVTEVEATASEQYVYHKRTWAQKEVKQANGPGWDTWSYDYDDDTASLDSYSMWLKSETLPSTKKINYFYESEITQYEQTGIHGRLAGFNYDSDSVYKTGYDYDEVGRFSSLTPGVAVTPFEYDYLPESNLIQKVQRGSGSSGWKQTTTYRTDSNLRSDLVTDFSGGNKTEVKLVYQNQNGTGNLKRLHAHKVRGWIGVERSGGTGGGQNEFFMYNTRSEVSNASAWEQVSGSWAANASAEKTSRHREFSYDPMGNITEKEVAHVPVGGGGNTTIVENFESGMDFWYVPTSSPKDWTLDSAGTPSSSTGPSRDSTLGTSSGTYLYMETSSGHAYYSGDTAIVESDLFLANNNTSISFRYHMYGSNIGSLYLEVYTGGSWVTLWSRSGQQHGSSTSTYSTGSASLAAFSGSNIKLRFRGVAAGSYRGDMAIDDLVISNAGGGGFSTNSLNQYTTFIEEGVSFTPEYDDAGNLTNDGLFEYTFDAKNQLVELENISSGVVTTFQYDPMGRRIEKNHGGTVTQYVYQGWNLIAELNGSNVVTKKYYWGLDASGSMQGAGGAGGLVMIEDVSSSSRYYPVYDGMHNIIGLQKDDATGSLVAWYEYDAFGNLEDSGGASKDLNPFRYSTKYTDFEIGAGLVYYGYRYYHPTKGRFVNRDPIAEAGGLNLYGFVGNNPANSVDAWGLIERPEGMSDGNWNLRQWHMALIEEHGYEAYSEFEFNNTFVSDVAGQGGSKGFYAEPAFNSPLINANKEKRRQQIRSGLGNLPAGGSEGDQGSGQSPGGTQPPKYKSSSKSVMRTDLLKVTTYDVRSSLEILLTEMLADLDSGIGLHLAALEAQFEAERAAVINQMYSHPGYDIMNSSSGPKYTPEDSARAYNMGWQQQRVRNFNRGYEVARGSGLVVVGVVGLTTGGAATAFSGGTATPMTGFVMAGSVQSITYGGAMIINGIVGDGTSLLPGRPSGELDLIWRDQPAALGAAKDFKTGLETGSELMKMAR